VIQPEPDCFVEREGIVMSRVCRACVVVGPSVLLLWATSGCVCPPCAGAQTAGAAPAAAAAPSDGTAAAASSEPGAGGIIWNGEGAGESAKGWADCDKKPDCKAALVAAAGVGKDGTAGLHFHGEGPGFIGMGWNWFGWWPETAGTDVSGYKNLTFWVRIDAKSPDVAPDLGGTSVSLGCSNGKKSSASLPFNKYAKDVLDGKWHKVSVPMAELMKGEGASFDPKTAWEFRVSTWAASPRLFDIYVDDIAFEK
jgi:hypothetical protein